MSLLRALQSDVAATLMQYLGLDTSHSRLLEVARPLRSSHIFAWEAAAEHDFNLFKFAENLRTDALCRRAVERMTGSDKGFARLWTSIPDTIVTTDFLAFACVHISYSYKIRSSNHSGRPHLRPHLGGLRPDLCRGF